ncbi:MAG: EAL domain-containing protein [Kordiimonadaceae bacterium]|nr:EAL domain-containing protein [Kordiimonadaceae bacterium]
MRVLVVDDDEVDFLNVKRHFKLAFPGEKHSFLWISEADPELISDKLHEYDICLIDQYLGAGTGIDIILNFLKRDIPIPLILLTGRDDDTLYEKAADAGASDYLVKGDLTPSLLKRSVRYCLAHKENEQRLVKYAFSDGLTGLANRLKFDQALDLAVQTSARNNNFLALIIIDLDDFKLINDTYGHAAGDTLLKELSRRLSAQVRQSDIVARLGGDEFGVIINGYEQETDIHILTNKLMGVFDKPIDYGTESFHGKGCSGVALLGPEELPRDAAALLRAADGALYRAKHKGKNTIVYYDQRLGETLQQSASMENALNKAVENNELELYYQPKINSETLTLSGAEALLRWKWTGHEQVSPAIFIPIAERSLSIIEIGQWVLEEACKKMDYWKKKGLNLVPIAINVSPIQLQSNTFIRRVIETLDQYDIDPKLIELEITESTLMEHVEHISDRMNKLASIGCKWVIDDFGIGHSSLSRIADLPISKIKVDQSFVQMAPTSAADKKICSIIVLLAHELNLELVAEGVETLSHINALTLLPQDELQGFYFSKPLTSTDFEVWLQPEQFSQCVDKWLLALKKAESQKRGD